MNPAPPVIVMFTAGHCTGRALPTRDGATPVSCDTRTEEDVLEFIVACGAFALVALAARFAEPLLSAPSRLPVAVVALAGAIGGLLADGAPTGWVPLDALLRAGLAAVTVAAAAAAGFPSRLWFTGISTVVLVVAESPVGLLAPVALGAVVAATAAGVRSPLTGAVAGGAAVQVLLRLDWPLAAGASAAVAAVALLPVMAAGARHVHGRARRLVVWGTVAVTGFCVLGAAAAGTAALKAKSDVDRGVAAAREGLALIGSDNRDEARVSLQAAAEAFSQAEATMSAWWARPARAVPFVAQQARAVSTLATAGHELATVAVDAIDRVDTDAIRPQGGRIDLAAIEELADPLGSAHDSLVEAERRLEDVDSPWLLEPLDQRHHELLTRVVDAEARASTALDAARLAPALMGGEGRRRYFLAIQTPAEARGSGGFMGNWGEITAIDGRLTLSRFGRLKELSDGGADPDNRTITGHDEYLERYGEAPLRYWGLINFSPDFPTVADVMAQLYPQSGGDEVDGVIAVDPYAFAALLRVTGPIEVPGWPDQLTADNAASVLLHEQYLEFAGPERVDFIGEAARLLFEKFTTTPVASPGVLASALGPAVDGRHLQLASTHEEEQRFFEEIGAAGAVPELRGDSVGFVSQNYNGNKIDWFLHRDATYDVTWDPGTGEVRGVLELTVHNDAPSTGLPHVIIGWGGDVILGARPVEDGENFMQLALYTAFRPAEVTVEGEPVGGVVGHEFERHVYSAYISVPPQSSRTVRVVTTGQLEPGAPYRLDPLLQPMVNADRLQVSVTLAAGWEIDSVTGLEPQGPRSAVAEWIFDRPHTAEISAVTSENSLLDRLRGE